MSQPKRTLTPDNFLETVTNLVTSLPVLLPAFVSPSTSAALREKVFLGVTSINEARYCKWAHTHWSMDQGVTLEEVKQILARPVESSNVKDSADTAAVRFGRTYAERLDKVDANAATALLRYYDEEQADEILAYVRFITFTNLLGNTADDFLNRLFVTVVGAAAAPLAIFLHLIAQFDSEVTLDALSPWRANGVSNPALTGNLAPGRP